MPRGSFLVGWVLLLPATISGFEFARAAQAGSFADGLAAVKVAALNGTLFFRNSTAHLWFLYYLIWFYAAFLLLVPLVMKLPASWRQRGRSWFDWVVQSRGRALILTVPTFLIVLQMPRGNLETSVLFLPQPRVLLIYCLFFGFGWLLYSSRQHLASIRRGAWWQVIAAVALMPVNMWALERVLSPGAGGPSR